MSDAERTAFPFVPNLSASVTQRGMWVMQVTHRDAVFPQPRLVVGKGMSPQDAWDDLVYHLEWWLRPVFPEPEQLHKEQIRIP